MQHRLASRGLRGPELHSWKRIMLRQPNGRGTSWAVTRRDRELPEVALRQAACADPGRELPEAVLKLAACEDPGRELPEAVLRLAVLVGMVRTKVPELYRLQRKQLRVEIHALQEVFRLRRSQVLLMATPITVRQAMPERKAEGLPLRSRKVGLTQDPLSSRRRIFLQRRMNLERYSSAHTAR